MLAHKPLLFDQKSYEVISLLHLGLPGSIKFIGYKFERLMVDEFSVLGRPTLRVLEGPMRNG